MAMKIGDRLRFLRGSVFGSLPRTGKWVFIVGCYNSGTTLLHDVLSAHPDVGSLPAEGQFLTDCLPVPKELGLPRLWALKPELFRLDEHDNHGPNAQRIKRQWGARFNNPNRPVLIEKTPTNAARTRWLQANFENPFFLGIIRNGYAAAEGIRRKAEHALALAAKQWSRSNEIMLEDFNNLHRKMIIRYETLAESPEATVGEVLAFLGLDKAQRLDAGPRTIHGVTSSIVNMNERSFAKLSSQDCDVIEREAGEMLTRLGYERLACS